jgi:hypothetical protein
MDFLACRLLKIQFFNLLHGLPAADAAGIVAGRENFIKTLGRKKKNPVLCTPLKKRVLTINS